MQIWIPDYVINYCSRNTITDIMNGLLILSKIREIKSYEVVSCDVYEVSRPGKPINNGTVMINRGCDNCDTLEHPTFPRYDSDLYGNPYIRLYKNFYVATVQKYGVGLASYNVRTICAAIVDDYKNPRKIRDIIATIYNKNADTDFNKNIERILSDAKFNLMLDR